MTLCRLAALISAATMLASCASLSEKGTLAELQRVELDLTDKQIDGGIEKAMQGYQKFLEETPESAMTPEALRRLADLKIEKEYGTFENPGSPVAEQTPPAAPMDRPEQAARATASQAPAEQQDEGERESQADFEARTAQMAVPTDSSAAPVEPVGNGLENKGAEEAITLYKQLLEKYPLYERNDQVLYQMTRAYEELGRVEDAVEVMNRIVAEYPHSNYIDEIQFRRGEFYFMRKRYLDAEEAYLAIVDMGSSSFYYEMSLYKLGWTFYKQDMHEEAMNQFVALLDHKIQTGYDFNNPTDEFEEKRVEDTHRVISLSFSAMGGPDAVVSYFRKNGQRSYEVDIYRNLGEHYLEKRRYADAASAYNTFVELNPYHKVSPHFDMRVIEIYKQGGFPKLVIEANKDFATDYGLKSNYWKHFEVESYPDVLALLKDNLTELANYYHALYQDPQFNKDKAANFSEAQHWYHEFLDSFPKDEQSPVMNYQLADLLLENKSYHAAALEYERTAYDYPAHEKAAAAGYAAVYAHRENLGSVSQGERKTVKHDVIRSSLRFAETFPQHEKASLVMGAALEDIFAMQDYQFAVTTGRKMLEMFPEAPQDQRRSAWLVVAHSSFELVQYPEAEEGYLNVLQLTAAEDESRAELTENLAASIYKQGEQASAAEDYQTAADHFLRLGAAAPTSELRPAAEYDAATAFVALENWTRSAEVLSAFRSNYPDHELQPDVTKKLAHVYSESGQLAQAAGEYERIESESDDEAVRREALKVAADLYIQADNQDQAMQVYRRFIDYFPSPPEPVVEMHHQIAGILKQRDDIPAYHRELEQLVAVDAAASGEQRTDRMRYLGAKASLVLTEPMYENYAQIKLVQPFNVTLKQKSQAMKAANKAFGGLLAYEVGEVNAAATYYIAEIYYNFSRSLKESERPTDMNELEMMQYEDMLDEQAFTFEEKAIGAHKKNIGFIDMGVYNDWVDKSVARLGDIVPGRYARFEESSGFIASVVNVDYSHLTQPALPQQVVVGGAVESQQDDLVEEEPAEVASDEGSVEAKISGVEVAVEPAEEEAVEIQDADAQGGATEKAAADTASEPEGGGAAATEQAKGKDSAAPAQKGAMNKAESGADVPVTANPPQEAAAAEQDLAAVDVEEDE